MIGRLLAGLAKLISGASAHWIAPPSDAPQRAYFANHSSHLDFVIIWAALPPKLRARTRPVAGSDYWMKGRLRRYLADNVFRAILIERAGPTSSAATATQSIQQIAYGMGDDKSIIVFPEGTRSMNGEVKSFKSGLYHLCRMKPDLELVPVYLANMNRILPKGEVLPVPLLGRVIFGVPMHMRSNEDKAEFLARAREAVLSLRNK
jgi:1-acyl-sn-glycerol-3-phosphate acyltransferase